MRIQQADREILAVDLHLLVNMALTTIPTDQRLMEGPIALDVHLRQPDLGAFARWYQRLPQLSGTMEAPSGCTAPLRH